MRILLTFVALFALLLSGIPIAFAQEEIRGRVAITPELVEAHMAYKAAQAQVRNYQYIALPTARRTLDDQVRLTRSEIAFLQRRLRDYGDALRAGEYSPIRTAVDSHLLALEAAQQRLRQLQDDRIALMRTTRQKYDMYNLEIVRAAARLAQEKQRALETTNGHK